MKNCLRVLVLDVAIAAWSHLAVAQIPNPGFEQWTAGNPDGWFTNNIPTFAVPVTQSSTRHSGSFSAQAEVVSAPGFPFYPPVLSSVFPVSQRHATLTFWVEFTSVGGDGAGVAVWLYNNQTQIALGVGETFESNPWELVTIPIDYFSTEIPDSCYIYFFVTGDSLGGDPHVGSVARVDDLAFSGVVSVQGTDREPLAFKLGQNYPNPFNPSTEIEFEIADYSTKDGSTSDGGLVSLKVFDLLGREVATIVNERMSPGRHTRSFKADGLPSGVYFYRLTAGGQSVSKRMVLLK